MTRFPKTPDFVGSFAPGRFEGEILDLEVIQGAVPRDLAGTFYRVGPDPAFAPYYDPDIFFNGDGAVSAFTFADGHVDFLRRYVRTEKFVAERKERRSLVGRYRNAYTDDPLFAGKDRTTANTNVVFHNGRLLAMKEDAMPYAMDPVTLETFGRFDFDGQVTSQTFTAHPKFDPLTGDMIAFGYEAKGDGSPDIAYYEIDRNGRVKREIWFAAPYAAMIHDLAVTDNFVVFPVIPLTVDIERMKRGGEHFQWQPGLDQIFGVLRRDGDARDVRWFRAPNGFQGHVLNAFEDRGRIYLDQPVANDNVFPFFADVNGRLPPPETLSSPLKRWMIDTNSNDDRIQATTLLNANVEFPRCDERFVGKAYRHGIVIGQDFGKPWSFDRVGPYPPFFFNTVGHVDVATGASETWWAGADSTVQEPIYVPRSADAPEGDGYAIALVNRLNERCNDLVVLDALHLEDGPVATIRVPVMHRMGLHGNWVPASAQAGLN